MALNTSPIYSGIGDIQWGSTALVGSNPSYEASGSGAVVAANVTSSNRITFDPLSVPAVALPMNIRADVAVVEPDALKRTLCTKLPDALAVNTTTAPDPLAS